MITSIILPALFVSSGLFALGVLVHTLRVHAGDIAAIRRQLVLADDTREFAVRLALTETRENLPVARRNAIRPRPAPQPARPGSQFGRRAVA